MSRVVFRSRLEQACKRYAPWLILGFALLAVACSVRFHAHHVGRIYAVSEYSNALCFFGIDRRGFGAPPALSPGETVAGFWNSYQRGPDPFPCERRTSVTHIALARWDVAPGMLRNRDDIVRATLRAVIRDTGIPITSTALREPGGPVLGFDRLGCFFDLHLMNERWSETFAPDGSPSYDTRGAFPATTPVTNTRRQFHRATRELTWDVTELARDWAVGTGTANHGIAIVPAPHFVNRNTNDSCIAALSEVLIDTEFRDEAGR